jgi:hypothetical protein
LQVLILAGLDAQFRRESQLEGPQARFLPASDYAAAAAAASAPRPADGADRPQDGEAEAARRRLEGLALSEAEAAAAAAAADLGVPKLEADALSRELELHSLLPPWPLLGALAAARVPALLLGTFASEGDNVADALALASAALRLLVARGAVAQEAAGAAAGAVPLRTPASWAGLYGRPYNEVA